MKRRCSVAALCLISASVGWSLDAESQRLADRYQSILLSNPAQETAFDRLWKIYADAGETPELVESARSLFKEHPKLGARILLRANLRAEADGLLAESAAAGSLPAVEMLADLREESGDFAAAAQLLEKATADHPDAGLFLRLGAAWQKAGEMAKARAAWEKAVTLSPKDLGLRARLAEASSAAGDLETAINHLRVVAENGSPTERFAAWEKISQDSEMAGQWQEAIAAQQALLNLMGAGHWKLASSRQRLIRLHEKAGTLDQLAEQWQSEAESRPNDPEFCLRMAGLFEFQGDGSQRLVWMRKAAAVLPKDFALARDLAALELAQGHFAEAGAIYDRLLERQPDHADTIFLRAEVFALAGNEAEAERRVEAFVQDHRDDPHGVARAEEFFRRLRLEAALERSLAGKVSADRADAQAVETLARFYIDEAKFDRAVESLRAFDDSKLSRDQQAATALRFSDLLRDGGMAESAEAFARRAMELKPGDPQYTVNLVELLATLDRVQEGEEILQRFGEVRRDNLPREDLDRRLFLILQARKEGWPLGNSNEAIRKIVGALEKNARNEGTENDWLRFARWQRWAGERDDVLREAVEKLPESQALQEALALQLAESGNMAGGIAAYGRLGEMAPERALEIRRKVGHLELDRGGFDEALRIFGAIQREQPNDWKAAADMALAQQMAGNWFEALEIWRKAYAMAPADARRGLRQPFLNATTRLQLFGRGLDFYEEISVAEKDPAARNQLLEEAAAYARENRVAEDWRSRLQRRVAAEPTEESWKTGLASLLAAEGKLEESDRLLSTLARGSEESPGEVEKLLKTAETEENWKEAARLAGRLAALRKAADVSLAMRQADFFEKARMMPEAERAWLTVATRHARNAEALAAAADFFGRTGDEARWEELYRAAAKLGGGAPEISLRLGMLALERGDRERALEDFENVLNSTRPDLALYKDVIPLPMLLQTRAAASPAGAGTPPIFQTKLPSEGEIEGCRLLAIQQLGQMLIHSPRKKKWQESLPAEIERVWALYFSGETEAAFDGMEGVIGREGQSSSREQVFSALLISEGAGPRLGRWASSDLLKSEKRWGDVQSALAIMLEAGWKPEAAFFEGVFSEAPAIQQWQMCRALAQANHFRLACELGEKVPQLFPGSQAASAWMTLANWHVALAEPEAAMRCLDQALEIATPDATYAAPFFDALRGRWLLTPEDERPVFARAVAEKLNGNAEVLAAALLASLAGENEKATGEIGKIFQPPLAGEISNWRELVNDGGARLEEWRLPRLARSLYRNDRKRSDALLSLQGENAHRLSETMLILSQLGTARPDEMPYFLNEWLARGASDEELMQAFLRLQQLGRGDAAVAIYDRLCARAPRSEIVAGALLNVMHQPQFSKSGFAYYEKLMADPHIGTRRAMMQNAGLRMAHILEQDGQVDRALALLEQIRRNDAVNRSLLLHHVDAMIRAGRHREALAELESGAPFVSAMPGYAIPMALLYANLGRESEALNILNREMRNTSSPDRIKAAKELRELAVQMADQSQVAAAEAVLSGLGQMTQSVSDKDWGRLLNDLDIPRLTPVERFRAGMNFLTAHGDLSEPFYLKEVERLQKLSQRHAALRPEFFVLRKVLAARRGTSTELEEQLLRDWNDGKGENFAGEIVFQMMFEQGRADKAAALLDGYLTDAHFNADAWDAIGSRFLEADRPAEARRVFEETIQRIGADARRRLLLGEALSKCGLTVEAEAEIEPVKRVAVLDRSRLLDLAKYYLAVGQPERASEWLNQAPPDQRVAAYRASAARAFARRGEFDAARKELIEAAKFPEALSTEVLVDFYASQNLLETLEHNEFAIPSRQWRELQLEALRRLQVDGRAEALWSRFTQEPGLLDDERGREILRELESSDWNRAAKIWETGDSLLWNTRCAMAAFYLRKFQAEKPSSLKDLARAHELHPGSFEIAQVYARSLLEGGKPAAARKVLQDVIAAFTSVKDRKAAREMLVSLQATPALPKEG